MTRGRDSKRSPRRDSRRPRQPVRTSAPHGRVDDTGILDQPLIQGLEAALTQPHPLSLLLFGSAIAELFSPAPLAHLTGAQPDRPGTPTVRELIDSFLDVGLRETDALLLVLARYIDDDVLRQRIRADVASRKRPVPGWLLRLDQTRVTDAMLLTHVLGDGDDLVLGVELPSGRHLTMVLYIDHNMGTLVKDAFALEAPIEEVAARLEALSHKSDAVLSALPLADAKAHAVDAIEQGRHTLDAPTSETWPACRPLLEWLVSLMPDGGTGYVFPEVKQAEIEAIAQEFLAVAGLAGDDESRDMAETLLWFGAEYGTGDPLRLSPVAVEIILLDLIPRKVVADIAYLDRMPDVLRALVPYAHGVRSVPSSYTRDALAAIDELEPEYRTLIRTPRHQGPMALLERMGAIPPLEEDDDDDLWDLDYLLSLWARAVGGVEVLNNLDTEPLASEHLDLSGVDASVLAMAEEIGRLVEGVSTELFDDEFHTVCLRILARVARSDAAILRRGKAQTAAAAVCWIALRLNDGGYRVTVKKLMEQLGLTGSPAQRALPMLAALGVAQPYDWSYDPVLGDLTLLTSRERAWLIERRGAIRHLTGDAES